MAQQTANLRTRQAGASADIQTASNGISSKPCGLSEFYQHSRQRRAILKDVLGRIRNHPVDRLAELLPFNWSPACA
jgi:hypothetical protein